MTEEVKVVIGREKYKTEVYTDQHKIIVDETIEVGGTDLGPNPITLFLSSLGTCKVITMRMYADRKQWPLEGVEINLSSEVVKSNLQQTTFIRCTIKLIGNLDEIQKAKIYKISEKCPVHQMFSNPIVIESNIIQ